MSHPWRKYETEGLATSRRKITSKQINEMRRLKVEGLTVGDIARRLGVEYKTVHHYLNR